MIIYDEFGLFRENADEAGLAWHGPPTVARRSVEVPPGQRVSALVWGSERPELLLVHGGAQNAHTWDTVALALGRPLVAVDLPGHGHSDWREDRRYGPVDNAEALVDAFPALVGERRVVVVGMSLGGLTAAVLASTHPELVERLILVDITPGVDHAKARAIIDFVRGPETFRDFDEIMARTVEHNPTRSESSLRRGVLHNAMELDDGRWTWRYDRRFAEGDPLNTSRGTAAHAVSATAVSIDFTDLWGHVERVQAPLMLCRGSLSPVVDDADVAELQRRQPGVRVEVVEGAGHSIQGDRPLELARLITDFAGFAPVA